MRKFIFIFALLSFITVCADGQTDSRRLSYTTYIGTGFSMNQPSYTPFNWQIVSHYHISQRFAIGAGSGLSVYEKLLIPLYAGAQFYITKPGETDSLSGMSYRWVFCHRQRSKRRLLPLSFHRCTI
ncbi:hypothetical protein NXW78_20770 [Bacteroides ovatus]|nr:hypothetical protein [Bacteroides ovatus]UVR09417.1 hypothetical protein NXW74_25915 [Bacteroides ovatus]